MAKDDYLPPTTGGTLRLKGAKDAGITKKKNKKKKAKAPVSPSAAQRASSASLGAGTGDEAATSARGAEDRVGDRILEGAATAKERGVNPLQEGGGEREGEGEGEESAQVYKTEAERRHEEMRRKRLDERLKREGVKTHKERVEELNRYLSNLSEHHDMPRIGPG